MQFIPRRKFVWPAIILAASVLVFVRVADAQSVYRQHIPIAVGSTVHVSTAFSDVAHYETLAAGDLTHPGRLTTCSGVFLEETRRFIHEYCYVSFDSGKTWNVALRVTEGWGNQDPTVAYGLGDDVYAVSLVDRNPDRTLPEDPDHPPHHDGDTVVFKSSDGGRTWHEASRFGSIDREFIAIDTTNGKYRGNVYVIGQGGLTEISGTGGPNGLSMWRSRDGGKTFLGPIQRSYPEKSILFGVGTGAILSDGTFVTIFGVTKPGQDQNLAYGPNPNATPNAELHVITTRDGGETFDDSHKIADIALDRARSEGGILNQLTADPGSKLFKDRLYAVFPAIVNDRIQIELSYSADKGKTWSQPVVVNDDRSPAKGGHGPDHLLPSVGVNKDGVVLVSWYDRREPGDNIGWRMRAAASLDGGQTFSASVPVTPDVNSYTPKNPLDLHAYGSSDQDHSLVSIGVGLNPFYVSGGHTSGLAVDADGSFHPTWIDNHSGVPQIWTSSLRVEGKPTKNGAPYLAKLDDVSKSVTVEFSKPQFDHATGTLTLSAQLLNTSKDTLEAPFKARVLTLESELGVAQIINADNGLNGTGAIWDFGSSLMGGKLASLHRSKPKTLVFHIADLRSVSQGKDFISGVVSLNVRMFAKIHKAKKGKQK